MERALRAFDGCGADAVVTIGGGSATGLAKALRLEREFFFVAVPTTYAGSELTDLYGITTRAGSKRTGRDPKVMPDVVLYDVELTLDMPLRLSVTSLLNALAHPLGALSTGKLDRDASERALVAASDVFRAIAGVLRDPTDVVARRAALRGTVLAATVLRSSPVGMHHHLAHAIGGRFDLDHAGLHTVLLPHSLTWLASEAPETAAVIKARVAADLPLRLRDFARRAGAATSLEELGVSAADIEQLIRERPELPAAALRRALTGSLD